MQQFNFIKILPNTLTISRLAFSVVVILLAANSWHISAFLVALILAISDYLDGWVAAKYKVASTLGSKLDPLADKVFVLLLAVHLGWLNLLPWWYVLLVTARNLSQLAAFPVLGLWLKIAFKVKPKTWPKFATAISFFLIVAGYFELAFGLYPLADVLFIGSLLLSALLEAYILIDYFIQLRKIATGKSDTFY